MDKITQDTLLLYHFYLVDHTDPGFEIEFNFISQVVYYYTNELPWP